MKTRPYHVLAFLIVAVPGVTQGPEPRYSVNTQQEGKRFQVFFSPFVRADTFLLDTLSCRVWQRQVTKNDENVQQELSVEDPPSTIGIAGGTRPGKNGRFVIVFSPFARADTMILDTDTGETWALYHDAEKEVDFFRRLSRRVIKN